MTRKFSQARRDGFLAALRQTGNQTIAAERDMEVVRADILRKVGAMRRHDPQQLARDRKAWARRRG